MGKFDSDGVSKPSRQKSCCEFMSTPSAWNEAWSKVCWQPHHPMLPQKRKLNAEADPSRAKCLLIPTLMWYIYGKECIWGAINFNAPESLRANDTDLYDLVGELARQAVQHAGRADIDVTTEHHKLDFEEINFEVFYKKHCSSDRTAFCIRDGSRKMLLKMYVGMGLELDREDCYGVVCICKNFGILGGLLHGVRRVVRANHPEAEVVLYLMNNVPDNAVKTSFKANVAQMKETDSIRTSDCKLVEVASFV